MTADEFLFFNIMPNALPLYEILRSKLLTECPNTSLKVQKSQITFKAKYGYAFVSLKRMKGCPEVFIIVSFGLFHRLNSPRIAIAVEPYPNRWTHHMIVFEAEQLDDELIGWLREAYDFAQTKERSQYAVNVLQKLAGEKKIELKLRKNGGIWMIREICKDRTFLARKSEPATAEDLCAAQDLLETLKAHKEGCVGMAANMIGMNKRIIVFDAEGAYMTMFHPEIIKRSGPYEAEEGCLSLTGTRKTKRFHSIKVRYQNEKFQTRFKTFTGWTAQIIQHEIDHCEGIII